MVTFAETGGLFNANGDPICMNDEIIPTRAPGHCCSSVELTVQMNKLIDGAVAGTSSATWTDFMQYTGKDDWIECMDIFMSSMTGAWARNRSRRTCAARSSRRMCTTRGASA